MMKKSNKKQELVPPQHQDFIVIDPESKKIQFDLILKNFLSSKDEGLALLECPSLLWALSVLCRNMTWASFSFQRKTVKGSVVFF